jgi:hypothetical protein
LLAVGLAATIALWRHMPVQLKELHPDDSV